MVLSISDDGIDWSHAWAVRNCVEKSCKPKFGGPPGFQYPGAMWKTDGARGPEIIFSYSINKEVGRISFLFRPFSPFLVGSILVVFACAVLRKTRVYRCYTFIVCTGYWPVALSAVSSGFCRIVDRYICNKQHIVIHSKPIESPK